MISVIRVFLISTLVAEPIFAAVSACDWLLADAERWSIHRSVAQSSAVTIGTHLAIIEQESAFRANAQADQRSWWQWWQSQQKISAYGWAQATDATWQTFEQAEQKKAWRSSYRDSVRFIDWYVSRLSKQLTIATDDVAQLYMAYHLGANGYRKAKATLQTHPMYPVAQRVALRSKQFDQQWPKCLGLLQWSTRWHRADWE